MSAGVLITAFVALGAVGLLLAMPGRPRNLFAAGLLMLAGAAALLLAALLPRLEAATGAAGFAILSLLALWSAVRVITHTKAVYSALYFVVVILAVAGLLLLIQAEFLAAALVIIYAGAILVTYVFVIMLAQQGGAAPAPEVAPREPLIGVITGFVLLAALALQMVAPATPAPDILPPAVTPGGIEGVGTALLTKYIVGVQIAAVLLLAAMVGSIAIARRRAAETPELEEAA